MKTTVLTMMLFFSIPGHAVSQVFDKHHWKDRVIVIHADDFSMPSLRIQLETLSSDMAGLKERKLVIYQVVGREFKTGILPSDTVLLFPHPVNCDTIGFTIRLIGLDGGVKLEKHHPIPLEDIFSLIDQMPMRQAEMKRKGKTKEGEN